MVRPFASRTDSEFRWCVALPGPEILEGSSKPISEMSMAAVHELAGESVFLSIENGRLRPFLVTVVE